MELKDICVDLELAKELKENGFEQDTIFSYFPSDSDGGVVKSYAIFESKNVCHDKAIPAPTTDELLKELEGRGVSIQDYENHYTAIHSPNDTAQTREAEKPCNALAKMWLYLKKEGLL